MAAAALAALPEEEGVLVLDDSNFQEALAAHAPLLVECASDRPPPAPPSAAAVAAAACILPFDALSLSFSRSLAQSTRRGAATARRCVARRPRRAPARARGRG